MKIDWETLSYALISSIIVTWVLGLILSMTGIVQIYPKDIDLLIQNLEEMYGDGVSMTIAVGSTTPCFLSQWLLIVISLILLIVLTGVFYFVINYLRKKKK